MCRLFCIVGTILGLKGTDEVSALSEILSLPLIKYNSKVQEYTVSRDNREFCYGLRKSKVKF